MQIKLNDKDRDNIMRSAIQIFVNEIIAKKVQEQVEVLKEKYKDCPDLTLEKVMEENLSVIQKTPELLVAQRKV